MASQEFERLMSAMPGGNVDHRDPVEVVREKMHAIHPTSASPTTLVEADSLDGIEAKWIATPENATSDRIVMHVHGGAFVSTVIDHYLDYGEHLSRHLGARVVCFQWIWADEAPYPRAVEDTLRQLPIPKVMTYQLADGWTDVKFVRPAHGLVALHGEDVIAIGARRFDLENSRRQSPHIVLLDRLFGVVTHGPRFQTVY